MLSELIENSKEESEFSTNQILKQVNKNTMIYYLPCYVRLKVKQILNVNIDALSATIAGTLLVSVYYGNLDAQIVDQFRGEGNKAILVQFSRMESILLKEGKGITLKEDEKDKRLDFVIRKDFIAEIVGNVFYTPFEIISLFLTATLQTLVLDPKQNRGQKIDLKFNCMNSQEAILINHGQRTTCGLYKMATHFLGIKYTNIDKNPYDQFSVLDAEKVNKPDETIIKNEIKVGDLNRSLAANEKNQLMKAENQKQMQVSNRRFDDLEPTKKNKLKPFQYAHFRVPLYKNPGVSLFYIFVPMWILGSINLLVFFQQNILGKKLGIIATLLLAFIAFIPTINNSIPKTSELKLIDIIVYLQILTVLLTCINALITFKNQPANFIFQWSDNGWFIAAVVINVIIVLLVVTTFIVHKLYWERAYLAPRNDQNKDLELIRQHWINYQCDWEFQKAIKTGRVVVI